MEAGLSVEKPRFASLFWIFFKIGCQAFGGYMAIISMAERALAKERSWITRESVVDLVAIGNLLPGPIAVNVSTIMGYRLMGLPGACAVWLGLLLPAFVACLTLYFLAESLRHGALFGLFLSGFSVGIVATVAAATFSISKLSARSRFDFGLMIFSAAIFVLDPFQSRIACIFLIYAIAVFGSLLRRPGWLGSYTVSGYVGSARVLWPFAASYVLMTVFGGSWYSLPDVRLELLVAFSAASLALYGGAYSFIPIIGAMVVDEKGWMAMSQFLEHVAIGQTSPGPVLISSASIGYSQAGYTGALLATLGLFGAPAAMALYCAREFARLKDSRVLSLFMTSLRPAVVGIIWGGVVVMGKAVFSGMSLGGMGLAFVAFTTSLYFLMRTKASHVLVAFCAGCAFATTGFLLGLGS